MAPRNRAARKILAPFLGTSSAARSRRYILSTARTVPRRKVGWPWGTTGRFTAPRATAARMAMARRFASPRTLTIPCWRVSISAIPGGLRWADSRWARTPRQIFYGTCQGGGANAEGSIHRLAVNLDAYTNSHPSLLANFNSTTNGSQPGAGITVGQDGNLYGVTYYGVTGAWGCFYSMPATGGAISLLGLFNNGGGRLPKAPSVLGPDGNFTAPLIPAAPATAARFTGFPPTARPRC